jgi:hypothetical protein
MSRYRTCDKCHIVYDREVEGITGDNGEDFCSMECERLYDPCAVALRAQRLGIIDAIQAWAADRPPQSQDTAKDIIFHLLTHFKQSSS